MSGIQKAFTIQKLDKIAAILDLPFKNRTKYSSFQMVKYKMASKMI